MEFEKQINNAQNLQQLAETIKSAMPKAGQAGGRKFEVKKASLKAFEKKFISLANKELKESVSDKAARSLGQCIGFIEQLTGQSIEQRQLSKLEKIRHLICGKQSKTIRDTLHKNVGQITNKNTRTKVSLSMIVHSMEWTNDSRANEVDDTLKRYVRQPTEENKAELLKRIASASPIGKIIPNIRRLGNLLTTEAKKKNIDFDFRQQCFTDEDLKSLDENKMKREEIYDTIRSAVDKEITMNPPEWASILQTWKPSEKKRQEYLAEALADLATADPNTIGTGVRRAVENFKEGIEAGGPEETLANNSLMRLVGTLFQKEGILLGREFNICREIMKLV